MLATPQARRVLLGPQGPVWTCMETCTGLPLCRCSALLSVRNPSSQACTNLPREGPPPSDAVTSDACACATAHPVARLGKRPQQKGNPTKLRTDLVHRSTHLRVPGHFVRHSSPPLQRRLRQSPRDAGRPHPALPGAGPHCPGRDVVHPTTSGRRLTPLPESPAGSSPTPMSVTRSIRRWRSPNCPRKAARAWSR